MAMPIGITRKPRIWYDGKGCWACSNFLGLTPYFYYGATPKEAYDTFTKSCPTAPYQNPLTKALGKIRP